MDTGDESVVVVVVTHDSAQLLPDLVASLPRGLGGLDWHLVVVDNDSSDGSAEAAAALVPAARIVRTGRNAGYAGGINAGLAAAGRYTAALVLNPDVRLEPGCVPALVHALRVPGTGIAVPLLLDARGRRIDSQRREPTLLRLAGEALLGTHRAGLRERFGEMVTDERRYAREAVTDWAEGSTLLIGAECLRATGAWDESFFLYSEETDFALRARDAGYATRFTPTARAVHLEGGSAGNPAMSALVVRNKLRLFRRRRGLPAAAVFWLLLLLREGSRALLGRSAGRAAARTLLSPRRLSETPGPHTLARGRAAVRLPVALPAPARAPDDTAARLDVAGRPR